MATRVFTIFVGFLLLSGCAARQLNPIVTAPEAMNCESSLGQFSVSLVASATSTGAYTLQVIPTQVNKPGQYVEIALISGSNQPLTLSNDTVLVQNQVLLNQTVTPSELSVYDSVAIALSDGGATPFQDLPASQYALCTMPQANYSAPVY